MDDHTACNSEVLTGLNYFFLTVFTFEAALRIFVLRMEYLLSRWDLFDFLVLLMGYVDLILSASFNDSKGVPGGLMLRLFRIARLMRATKLLRVFPELHAMVNGFFSAMSAMWWGFIMITVLLLMWSVLAVELLYSVSREVHGDTHECSESMSSVFTTMLLLFQTLMAGDSWGTCSLPIIRAVPGSIFIFGGSLFTIQLGFTNLVLAVIVEKAQEARETDRQRLVEKKNKKRAEAEKKLSAMCQEIDIDQDGSITMEEFFQAYEDHEDMRECLQMLDIDKSDLECLFHLMDADDSGELTYAELIDCIHKSDTNDLKRQMMLIKLQVEDVWVRVRDHMQESLDLIVRKLDGLEVKETQVCHETVLKQGTSKVRGAMLHQNSNSSSFLRARTMRLKSLSSLDLGSFDDKKARQSSPMARQSSPTAKLSSPTSQSSELKDVRNGKQSKLHCKSLEAAAAAAASVASAAASDEIWRERQQLDEELRILERNIRPDQALQTSSANCEASVGWENAQTVWGGEELGSYSPEELPPALRPSVAHKPSPARQKGPSFPNLTKDQG
eukprot:TRINITY_DN106201_c0_g1_i1.p1 TRINITY_DN106201_c0_g1~~TRINITY_DN106201_c0_g1_i1.p1  ORF type:complete len:648 (-),score=125.04 TRINITY_DN106201_c0_g1_i1:12-1682(-)